MEAYSSSYKKGFFLFEGPYSWPFSTAATTTGLFFGKGLATVLARLGFEVFFADSSVCRNASISLDLQEYAVLVVHAMKVEIQLEFLHRLDHCFKCFFMNALMWRSRSLPAYCLWLSKSPNVYTWLPHRRIGVEGRHNVIPITKWSWHEVEVPGVCTIREGFWELSKTKLRILVKGPKNQETSHMLFIVPLQPLNICNIGTLYFRGNCFAANLPG